MTEGEMILSYKLKRRNKMYLTKTKGCSFNTNPLWTFLSKDLNNQNLKNQPFHKELKKENLKFIIKNESIQMNQKDKLIFEMVLYQYQQKKYPDILDVNLEQLCLDLGYKPYTREKTYIFDRLKLFSLFRIEVYKDNILIYNFDFADINCYLDDNEYKHNIRINFNGKGRTALKVLFFDKKPVKKYLLPFKSEWCLLMSEFLQLKTQVKSRGSDHPFGYRYRNFSINTVLEYFNLTDEYNHAIEFFDDKKITQLKQTISKTLTKLYKYGKKNNIPIPKYRYNKNTNMYEIKDFNYPENVSNTDRLKDIQQQLKDQK